MDFVHLHNHSHYSILDGAMTIDTLVNRAVDLGMPGIALTDHGNMFGAIEFYQKAKKAGIKPIIGEEFYVSPGSRFTKEFVKDSGEEKFYHLVLLAKNDEGYRNLIKLSSIGFLEGFYYKPRIDWESLEKYSGGLICASACLAGEIPVSILKGNDRHALTMAGKLQELFGPDHFYLELQDHGLAEQKKVNTEIIRISEKLNIPLIATNDAHYAQKGDAYAHEVLLSIQTGKTMKDEHRMRFGTDQFYLKSGEEMARLFSDYPDALYNTTKIFDMIDLELQLGNPILPHFEVPEGFNLDSFLKHLVQQGAVQRYGTVLRKEVQDRIDYELSVITGMKFSGYFLIVWDFINHARSIGIPVGPGRGSAAGSIVSYCLGITALDPLKYNLLFERFLNPDRNEMPDMDIDFDAVRREEVIDYVRQKYGEEQVSQIITFNTMGAKGVVKDVARALDIPFQRANDISKHIDGKTLADSLKGSKELQKFMKEEESGAELTEISLKLEGLVRSAGKHAAGVVISRGPLTDYVPLYKDPREGSISSQFEKNTLEAAGLVKMDFLGLKNLTIIDTCLRLIKESTGDVVDIENIPLDDLDTFALLQRADTRGVFQLESKGMQAMLRRLGPTQFEDIIAIVALYRPGPLNSGMAEDFILRKKNPSLVKYPHPELEPVLSDTLGVVVYQEQVMLISQIIAGFTLPEADKLRKAMGKKKVEIINELEGKFLKGAEEKGIDRKLAQDLYDMIRKFGEYGFNKSHSAAYALVTYQTAYLKAHYPTQYLTALLSAQPDKQDDVIQYINDARSRGIAVLPPDVGHSFYDFTIEENAIRFGLSAIKGVGEKAIDSIVGARREGGPFTSLRDFLERIDLMVVNRGVLEALVRAGAMCSIHSNRGQLFNAVEMMLESARRYQEDRKSGQGDLFSMGAAEPQALELPESAGWDETESLHREKEVLGVYLSGHPLAKYEDEIRIFSPLSIGSLEATHGESEVSLVGVLGSVEYRKSRGGRTYVTAMLEDMEGSLDLLIFGKTVEKYSELINGNDPVLVTGQLEMEGEQPGKLIVKQVKSIREARRESISALHLKVDPIGVDENFLNSIRDVLGRYRGSCPVYIHIPENEGEKIIRVHQTFNVQPSEELVVRLVDLLGSHSIRYSLGHAS